MPLLTEESLNDFFLPSQDCIKPVEINKTNADSEIKIDNGIHWEISKDGIQTQLEAASISLNDCLACSGCVTTAESVLIGLQSWSEVEATLKAAEKKIIVGSVCPQSIASIAASYDLPIDLTFKKLRTLLKSLGFSHVLSTNVGREVSLHESAQEFIRHYRSKPKSPLLASACPGWICYAEKQKSSLIPTISKVRSPQQMTGVMLKDVLTRSLRTHAGVNGDDAVTRGDIYHVAIMPCFDKKLEASRLEFQVETVRDVDTVVTSAEVVDMMRANGIDFAALPEEPVVDDHNTITATVASFDPPTTGRHAGSSSGGYLAHILVSAASALFSIHDIKPDLCDPRVRITVQKSPKLKEYVLLGPSVAAGGSDDAGDGRNGEGVEGEVPVLLRFAECYGFKQITSLTGKLAPRVQRRTTKKLVAYDYVEVMACESGCINGGGQVRPPEGVGNGEWVDKVESLYRDERESVVTQRSYDEILAWWTGTEVQRLPEQDENEMAHGVDAAAQATRRAWETTKGKMVTTYNEIPPLVNPLASKW